MARRKIENIKKIKEYAFEIYSPGEKPINPLNDLVDLIVWKNNEEYTGSLVTLTYLETLFVKNRQTGECARGSYFAMPRLIIVKDLYNATIEKTLDDLIENNEFKEYFK